VGGAVSKHRPLLRGTGLTLAVIAALLLAACGGGGGGGGSTAPPPGGACTGPVDIAPASATAGTLASGDCTIEALLPGTGDQSFVDLYRVTLPSSGRYTIRLDSTQFDAFLFLLDSASQFPPINFDDDSAGNSNALISMDLVAGTYIIGANSAMATPESGAYSLTSTFAPTIWFPTSTTGVPEARQEHTAVWTGSEMIVWGGQNGNSIAKNTGARFDPVTNAWTSTATAGAPSPRWAHSAVWTGTEMIVWGGFSGFPAFQPLNDGAKYNPQTDSWTTVASMAAPSVRVNHTAVWTGAEMIVWGGFSCMGCPNPELGTGARYNPATNAWTATSGVGAPAPRGNHTAVWTGSTMIVWGGEDDFGVPDVLGTGAVYDPAADNWVATNLANAPAGRRCHSAVWAGTEMIIFGGQTDRSLACGISTVATGARYSPPPTDSWNPMVVAPVSSTLSGAPAVWTGSQLITWFESSGARYNFAANTWNGISPTGAPASRRRHSLIWTGSSLVVWGGDFAVPLNTGGIYDPSVDPTP